MSVPSVTYSRGGCLLYRDEIVKKVTYNIDHNQMGKRLSIVIKIFFFIKFKVFWIKISNKIKSIIKSIVEIKSIIKITYKLVN